MINNNHEPKNLVWIDLEMTGLRPERDVILEIATIITDNHLNILAQGPELVIHQPDEKLAHMNDWVREAHTKSGLVDAVQKSTISVEDAQEQTMYFIKQHCIEGGAQLAGNSVWQDRTFLYKYMPQIVDYMFYRLIDVSTIKELVRAWYPEHPQIEFEKKETHRALDDIKESIAELVHYKKHFFK